MEVAVRAQPIKVLENAFATSVPVVLKALAGKVARLPQYAQACDKFVAELKVNAGIAVRAVWDRQVLVKFVPADTLISGNEVR